MLTTKILRIHFYAPAGCDAYRESVRRNADRRNLDSARYHGLLKFNYIFFIAVIAVIECIMIDAQFADNSTRGAIRLREARAQEAAQRCESAGGAATANERSTEKYAQGKDRKAGRAKQAISDQE